MLQINPQTLESIAAKNGWLHERGRLKGSLNASAMAEALGVAKSTVTRAYDGAPAGAILIERLQSMSGLSLDLIVSVSPGPQGRAA